MPTDSALLRSELIACIPSIVIDGVAKESGQRVVYFAHFQDDKIPPEILRDEESHFLKGWESWGPVVIKVVSGAGVTVITRLQAEANLLAEIKSSQFPELLYSNYFTENPVTEIPLAESLYVSVEEFVESTPLTAKLFDYIGNPIAVFRITSSIVSGLRPLWEHKRKLVHRDVKPDNLLVTPDGDVVIIDFGIIRETGAIGLTQEGWLKAPFTPGYAAPEHIANDKDLVSFKTDFFSLGVVMYQLISGKHPFYIRDDMDMGEVIDATENHIPPTLLSLGVATPAQSALVARMMEKKPYLRPRTIEVLLQELNKVEEKE
jgi:serine/threonine protein kinase